MNRASVEKNFAIDELCTLHMKKLKRDAEYILTTFPLEGQLYKWTMFCDYVGRRLGKLQ